MVPNNEIKACVDRGSRATDPCRIDCTGHDGDTVPTPMPSQTVLLFAKKWPNDSVLRVHFMDGDPWFRRR